MPLDYHFICPLPNGLHARPASHLRRVANRFQSSVAVVNERNGAEANAKSVLSLIGSAILYKDPLCLRVSGDDEGVAIETLTQFVNDRLATCDPPLPDNGMAACVGRPLPRSLKICHPAKMLRGVPVSRGVAEGRIVWVGPLPEWPRLTQISAESAEKEFARFQQALSIVRDRLISECEAANESEAEILNLHLAILGDVNLANAVERLLTAEGTSAAQALPAAIEEFSTMLREGESDYLRERVLDLQDVGASLLAEMYGTDANPCVITLTRPAIVFAENLSPGQFLALDRRYLRGLVLQHAGRTSHTVVLARSFGIPTITGISTAADLSDGEEVVLDANLGILVPSPNPAIRRYYAAESRKQARIAANLEAFRNSPGKSRDGCCVQILANVSSAAEVAAAIKQGAEGIGLYRTEMLFIGRTQPPSEDEQAAAYTEAVQIAGGRTVALRTFDLGGDKQASYLGLPQESNPFLGYRGARIYNEFAPLLKTQLRAIFRAAQYGSVKILAPMIARAQEMRVFRTLVEDVRKEFPKMDIPVGMMIEVPSAVFAMPELCDWADFFSLGTNDLAQYFFAASRDSITLRHVYRWQQPSFLRVLKHAIDGARARGRPVSLCGELGDDEDAQLILLGLGVDSLSIGAPGILKAKANLARSNLAHCRELADAALKAIDCAGVDSVLREFRREKDVPLLSADMIVVDSEAQNKTEAIKELTDLLAIGGRSEDTAAVEEAVWVREEACPTDFCHGFAVPHCKTDHVTANSITFLRLREPVDWESSGESAVRVVILLAIRSSQEGNEHLRILSHLSRLLMRAEFRDRLETAPDVSAVLSVFREELSL